LPACLLLDSCVNKLLEGLAWDMRERILESWAKAITEPLLHLLVSGSLISAIAGKASEGPAVRGHSLGSLSKRAELLLLLLHNALGDVVLPERGGEVCPHERRQSCWAHLKVVLPPSSSLTPQDVCGKVNLVLLSDSGIVESAVDLTEPVIGI
jgi:hypothetical protein